MQFGAGSAPAALCVTGLHKVPNSPGVEQPPHQCEGPTLALHSPSSSLCSLGLVWGFPAGTPLCESQQPHHAPWRALRPALPPGECE